MRSGWVAIRDVSQYPAIQMPFPQDEHVVQTFSSHTAPEPLRDRIPLRRAIRFVEHFNRGGHRHARKRFSMLSIVIPNQEARWLSEACLERSRMVASRSGWSTKASEGERVTLKWTTRREARFDHEIGIERRKKRSITGSKSHAQISWA